MQRILRFGAVAIVLVGALTACAPATVDEVAAQEWLDGLASSGGSAHLAEVSGMTSSPAETEDGFVITFDEPFPSVRELRAGCYGAPGETAMATWTVRSASNWSGGGGGEIPCDGSMVPVPTAPDIPAGVNEVRISVTRDGEPRTFFAALDAAPAA